MAWKLKKEWEGKSVAHIKVPLNELTPQQILSLSDASLDKYFIEDKPKKKKKDDSFAR
jgi:hypothetical protein